MCRAPATFEFDCMRFDTIVNLWPMGVPASKDASFDESCQAYGNCVNLCIVPLDAVYVYTIPNYAIECTCTAGAAVNYFVCRVEPNYADCNFGYIYVLSESLRERTDVYIYIYIYIYI